MELDSLWSHRRVLICLLMVLSSFLLQSLIVVSLNDEGMALLRFKDRIENDPFGALLTWKENSLDNNPCSWFGVDCVDGHVVSLKLKDLCLTGTLAPELDHLVHIKLIMLRNNSLYGVIPEEFTRLKELEVLDLGFNNFNGPLSHEWDNIVAVLLLDNNAEFCHVPPEVEKLMMISEVQVEASDVSSKSKPPYVAEHVKALPPPFMRCDHQTKDPIHRRQLLDVKSKPSSLADALDATEVRVQGDPSPPPQSNTHASPRVAPPPPPSDSETTPSSPTSPTSNSTKSSSSGTHKLIIPVTASVGGFILVVLIVGLFIWRHKKTTTIGPWGTGTSRSIQRSTENGNDKSQFLSHGITNSGLGQGGLNLKRSELEVACEEFSNVIGSSTIGTLYKGTLSSKGEITVLSYDVKNTKDWSTDMQMLFRNKVDKLSKVSHKNFLNLLGYCEEEKPFTRMLVFEYAPSGTLFEHLYVRESEHLDWTMRIRIMMGISYCLEHMHTLTPSITHEDLTAYAVNLSEDYAAKLSDFGIWNEVALAANPLPILIDTTTSPDPNPEDNVYRFGLVILEMITGKAPHSMSKGSLNAWALDYLRGDEPLRSFVDPMLRHYDEEQVERIGEVIKLCTLPYPNEKPRMDDVASRLREITGIEPDRAAPRLSLWY